MKIVIDMNEDVLIKFRNGTTVNTGKKESDLKRSFINMDNMVVDSNLEGDAIITDVDGDFIKLPFTYKELKDRDI